MRPERIWKFDNESARDSNGTNNGVAVDDVSYVISTRRFYMCTAADAGSSTWTRVNDPSPSGDLLPVDSNSDIGSETDRWGWGWFTDLLARTFRVSNSDGDEAWRWSISAAGNLILTDVLNALRNVIQFNQNGGGQDGRINLLANASTEDLLPNAAGKGIGSSSSRYEDIWVEDANTEVAYFYQEGSATREYSLRVTGAQSWVLRDIVGAEDIFVFGKSELNVFKNSRYRNNLIVDGVATMQGNASVGNEFDVNLIRVRDNGLASEIGQSTDRYDSIWATNVDVLVLSVGSVSYGRWEHRQVSSNLQVYNSDRSLEYMRFDDEASLDNANTFIYSNLRLARQLRMQDSSGAERWRMVINDADSDRFEFRGIAGGSEQGLPPFSMQYASSGTVGANRDFFVRSQTGRTANIFFGSRDTNSVNMVFEGNGAERWRIAMRGDQTAPELVFRNNLGEEPFRLRHSGGGGAYLEGPWAMQKGAEWRMLRSDSSVAWITELVDVDGKTDVVELRWSPTSPDQYIMRGIGESGGNNAYAQFPKLLVGDDSTRANNNVPLTIGKEGTPAVTNMINFISDGDGMQLHHDRVARAFQPGTVGKWYFDLDTLDEFAITRDNGTEIANFNLDGIVMKEQLHVRNGDHVDLFNSASENEYGIAEAVRRAQTTDTTLVYDVCTGVPLEHVVMVEVHAIVAATNPSTNPATFGEGFARATYRRFSGTILVKNADFSSPPDGPFSSMLLETTGSSTIRARLTKQSGEHAVVFAIKVRYVG